MGRKIALRTNYATVRDSLYQRLRAQGLSGEQAARLMARCANSAPLSLGVAHWRDGADTWQENEYRLAVARMLQMARG